MTPVRLLVQISVFCVFCLFITRVRFPVMPVADVENIIVKGSQIKCDSGCELMKEKINQMSCYRKNHGNSGSKDQDDKSVSVSYYCRLAPCSQSFECTPDVKVPDQAKLTIDTFQCQFSDEVQKLLIEDSCALVYSDSRDCRPGHTSP